MTSWANFKTVNPKLAEFGSQKFKSGVAYLATIRRDGSPRIHPVSPIITPKRLCIFMEPKSPKGFDLKRNKVYALHSSVDDVNGSNGEFRIKGKSHLITDFDVRNEAIEASNYQPKDSYILFELSVEEAGSTEYIDDKPVYKNWKI